MLINCIDSHRIPCLSQRQSLRSRLLSRLRRGAGLAGLLAAGLALSACSKDPGSDPVNQPPSSWRPFNDQSPWNLPLPATRTEVMLSATALGVAPMTLNDGDYGIRLYFARDTDPMWSLEFDQYNSVFDDYNTPSPLKKPAPSIMIPPGGTDGTVLLVDPTRALAYEMWQYHTVTPGSVGHAAQLEVVDLAGTGRHRNVGVTAAGLPGIGGVLRASELASGDPIRHRLWLALHRDLLLPQVVCPAVRTDVSTAGRFGAIKYGEVLALNKSFDIDNGPCALSPVLKRVARALKDYGGIVQDAGGDSIAVMAEVDAVRSVLDVNEATYYEKMACLRGQMVKVSDPWPTGVCP